jgi:hypothetical protein
MKSYLIKEVGVDAHMFVVAREMGFTLDCINTVWADSEMDNQDLTLLQQEVDEIKRTHRILVSANKDGVSFYSKVGQYTVIIVEDQGYQGIFWKL